MNVERELSANTYTVTHAVGPLQDGLRIDAFLKSRYSRRSREAIQRAIADGHIQILREGSHRPLGKLKPSTQVLRDDRVAVTSQRRAEPEVNFGYRTVFEDDALLVLDKPPMLPVHPSGRFFFNTLLTHLQTKGFTQPQDASSPHYLVHRIDKETSGILVLAKTKEAAAHVTAQFARRETSKTYLAVVRGLPPAGFENARAMGRSPTSSVKLKMEILPEDQGGQSALTRFEPLHAAGPFALVRCHPKTGRQHQIRVHLDDSGYPIVGDKLYGLPMEDALKFYDRRHLTQDVIDRLLHPRHALHAHVLELAHPVTGKALRFEAPLPQDLAQLLAHAQAGTRLSAAELRALGLPQDLLPAEGSLPGESAPAVVDAGLEDWLPSGEELDDQLAVDP